MKSTPSQGSPTLSQALEAIDQADSPGARIRAAADVFAGFGFNRVLITLRDASLNPTLAVAVQHGEHQRAPAGDLQPLPGAVWRRRLVMVDRFRDGELFLLDGADEWVAREFFGRDRLVRTDETEWLDTDLLLGLLRGAEQELLGIVKMASPNSGRRPSAEVKRDIGVLVRHLAARIAYDSLRALAQQRADRLQRLQEAGAALARSLDEHEIVRELARHALRVTRGDGVTITYPDLDHDLLTTALRIVRGVDRPRSPMRLGDGIIAEVARTGRPVRVGDRESDRLRERDGLAVPLSLYDVVGDASAASSVLAVPLRSGIQLVGVLVVFAAARDVFDAEDEEVLSTMASQAATAIANARRYAESESDRRQTEALAEVARAVSESLRLGDVLRLILRHAVALLGAEGACVALRKDDYLNIVAAVGAADVLAGVHLPLASSLIGHAVTANERVVSNDVAGNPYASRAVLRLAPVERTVIAPLVTGQGSIGALCVINREQPFGDDDARVLQRLADHVAVAIVNARLFEEVERATHEWKLAFDSIASGVVVLDDAQRVRRCNLRSAEMCGTTIPGLLGQHFGQALLGRDAAADGQALDSLIQFSLEAGVPVRQLVEDRARGRSFEMLAAPHPDGGCVLTFDNVTARRVEAVALARSEERYERLVESASDAIFTVDASGCFTSVNMALLTSLGTTRDALLGAPCTTFIDPTDVPAVEALIRQVFTGKRGSLELRVATSDGSVCVGMLRTAPIVEDGQVAGVLCILRDITNEEIRRESGAQLERLAALGQMLTGVANEINNPLASLLAVAELEAKTMSPDAPHHRVMAQIREEAHRVSRVVAQLVENTNAPSIYRNTMDVNRVVRGALDLHGYHLLSRRIRIETDFAPGLPVVAADGATLQQVVTNLLVNAEVALEEWTGTRVIRVVTREAEGRVLVEVIDSGPGIDASQVARVFEPKFNTRDAQGGRGLGLAIARALLRPYGGKLDAASTPGAGATFTLSLSVASDSASGPQATVATRETGTAPKYRLLLVEDERTLSDTISRFLRFEGYEVDVAQSGRDALGFMQARWYDLVLLDLRMQDMTGEDVYRAVNDRDPAQAERVLFITGDMQRQDAAAFVRSTGRAVLAKPFQLADLGVRVAELLAG